MKLAVYVDDVYRLVQRDGRRLVTADRAFLLFVCEVGGHFDETVLVGRALSDGTSADYELPADVQLVALPYYSSLRDLRAVIRGVGGTVRGFWRAAGRADVVWAFGPHPLQLLFVLAGLVRGRRVVLGVRQDTVEYYRARLPSSAWRPALPLARLLDSVHRLLARRLATTVVGHALAARYQPGLVLPMTISLVRADERGSAPPVRDAPQPFELLTVGRLDAEKSPQLVIDALALLDAHDPGRFRLTWVGRGPLEEDVRRRAAELGVAALLDLRGYVPHGAPLFSLYRRADLFVHASLTEGVPQVLVEALALGVPAVATDVGGVRAAVGNGSGALLVPPGNAQELATAVRNLADDPQLRRDLVARGLELTDGLTLQAEAARVSRFLGAEATVDGSEDSRTSELDKARV